MRLRALPSRGVAQVAPSPCQATWTHCVYFLSRIISSTNAAISG